VTVSEVKEKVVAGLGFGGIVIVLCWTMLGFQNKQFEAMAAFQAAQFEKMGHRLDAKDRIIEAKDKFIEDRVIQSTVIAEKAIQAFDRSTDMTGKMLEFLKERKQ
jgi:hypothetical protein